MCVQFIFINSQIRDIKSWGHWRSTEEAEAEADYINCSM